MVTVRSVLSLAAFKNLKLWKLDVKNAIIYREVHQEFQMEKPQESSLNNSPIITYVRLSVFFVTKWIKPAKGTVYVKEDMLRDPRTPHLEEAKRILGYIKGSID
uniref:Reverse transcriptase Ty1/copia-type domain-containing protein n=1 Tax=Solanum lycopersicum TaxID=4081 RepID=A0A3Q7IF92_SOLLC